MTFDACLREIESSDFSVRLGVASSLTVFLAGARREESVREIWHHLESRQRRGALLSRIERLSRLKTDFRYTNCWDTALTVYLWLLGLRDSEATHEQKSGPGLALLAARRALVAERCWWSRMVAEEILQGKQFRTDAGLTPPRVAQPGSFAPDARDTKDEILDGNLPSRGEFLLGGLSWRTPEAEPKEPAGEQEFSNSAAPG